MLNLLLPRTRDYGLYKMDPEMIIEEVVWHVLEHEIHQRGEIYLMLSLQGIEAPDV